LVEIKGLEKLAPRDFPGHISASVFTGGCNFRCPYCHNADLVLKPDSLATMPREEFIEFLELRQGWLEAVCVTGGEPLMHEDLERLLADIKERGLLIKLDTNGSFPGRLEGLISAGLVDFVAMDVKAPLERYEEAAGVSVAADSIRESVAVLRDSGCGHLFRTTVVPGLLHSEDIEAIAAMLKGVGEYVLQPFVPGQTLDPEYSNRPSSAGEELSRLAEIARRVIPRVTVGGT
jgi:pyruvate formate lyase activating enzyme